MRRVALCDDEAGELEETAQTLREFAGTHGVAMQIAAYSSVEELLTNLARQSKAAPDVLFMDIEFDGHPDGIRAVARVNELAPGCQVVYLSN